jgi:hypothetical protein
MAPRLKILMSSGYKKETQIYFPFFLKNVLASESLPGSPMGRYLHTGHFYISLDTSRGTQYKSSPSRSPLWSPLIFRVNESSSSSSSSYTLNKEAEGFSEMLIYVTNYMV